MNRYRRADLTGLGVHRGKGPALPKTIERGNLSLDTAVVRWTGSGGASPQPCYLAAAGIRDARRYLH
jgi:hypothetical protein